MSEAYYHLNPYQYTTNNPVKFIDINGDYIYIYDNGTKYRYDNGQLYSKNEETGKFDVEYTASEGSYASQILGMLNQIGCEDCKGGKAFLNLFNNDDFNVGIRNNTYNTYNTYNGRYKGKNVTRQNGKSMEVMTFFNQNENIATTSGFESLTKNMFATIGHELGHALSDFIFDNKVTDATWYSMTNDRGTTSNIKNDEVYAMFIENMIRRENNIPQRTHYTLTGEGSVMEESRMMKKVNKTWMIDDKAYSILQKIQQTQKK